MYIIVWRNSHREPFVDVDSRQFLESYYSYEEAKAAAERAARERIEAEAKAAAAKAAQEKAAAEAKAAAAAKAAAEANATASAVPSALLPPQPQLNPNRTATDPIADIIAADPVTGATETGAEAEPEVVEAPPAVAPRRHRARKARPDDWKKNYSIFGGGF